MDFLTRQQVRLILENAEDLTRKGIDGGLVAIYSSHASQGRLQSGATIISGVECMERLASQFIADSVAAVAQVAKDVEAYAMIEVAFEQLCARFNCPIRRCSPVFAGTR